MKQPRFTDTYSRRDCIPLFDPALRLYLFLVVIMVLAPWISPGAAALDTTDNTTPQETIPVDENAGDLARLENTPAVENEAYAYDLVNKGIECYNAGDYACTWRSFDTAHGLSPNNTDILYLHGYFLYQVKKYDEAQEKIDAALALDPNNANLWYERGTLLEKAGNYSESGRSFDRALALDPGIEVSLLHRFPINVIAKNISIVVLVAGFAILGIYIYSRERRR